MSRLSVVRSRLGIEVHAVGKPVLCLTDADASSLAELLLKAAVFGVTKPIVEYAATAEPCESCRRPPGVKNHVPGHVFVGWGQGWQPCPVCKGSMVKPAPVSVSGLLTQIDRAADAEDMFTLTFAAQRREIESRDAEITRLREALTVIADDPAAPPTFAGSVARAALESAAPHAHRFATDDDGAVHPCACGEPYSGRTGGRL